MTNNDTKHLYIVISQTGTILSKLLRIITKKDYNHASISLMDDLSLMYSFGRVNPYNPFIGGFVIESADFGTFKRFYNTKVIVLALDVSTEMHQEMTDALETMYECKYTYGYNYLGIYLAALKIARRKKNCYYCSEFVREFLQKYDIYGLDNLKGIVHPMDFMKIPDSVNVYYGRLKDFKTERKVGIKR